MFLKVCGEHFFERTFLANIQRTFLERLSGVDLGHVGARGGFVLSVGPTSSQHDGKGDDSGIVSPTTLIFGDTFLMTFW